MHGLSFTIIIHSHYSLPLKSSSHRNHQIGKRTTVKEHLEWRNYVCVRSGCMWKCVRMDWRSFSPSKRLLENPLKLTCRSHPQSPFGLTQAYRGSNHSLGFFLHVITMTFQQCSLTTSFQEHAIKFRTVMKPKITWFWPLSPLFPNQTKLCLLTLPTLHSCLHADLFVYVCPEAHLPCPGSSLLSESAIAVLLEWWRKHRGASQKCIFLILHNKILLF